MTQLEIISGQIPPSQEVLSPVDTENALRAARQDISNIILRAGQIIQIVNTQTGVVSTGNTLIPFDISIPQKTEGDEYMTLAITPSSATNKLKIDVIIHLSHSSIGADYMIAALFQDDTTNALAAGFEGRNEGVNEGSQIAFKHYMAAGTTSETTFKVRAGTYVEGTTTFNGVAGFVMFGEVLASSITITEIKT